MLDDPPQYTLRLRLMQHGFGVLALAIGLLCLAEATILALPFDDQGRVQWLRSQSFWIWAVDAPITWGSLAGAYLIWTAWTHPAWRRWAGLLVMMNATDAALWTLSRADRLGLPWADLATTYDWTIYLVASGLGWCELTILAGLAVRLIHDHSASPRDNRAPLNSGVPPLASFGIILWTMMMLSQTDWTTGIPQPRLGPAYPLLLLASAALYFLASFQVTTLCLNASRIARKRAGEQLHKEPGEELIALQSDPFHREK